MYQYSLINMYFVSKHYLQSATARYHFIKDVKRFGKAADSLTTYD